MSGEKAEVRVRPACHDDYRGVMDINKHVYYGIDYLPDMFHHYIRHPQAHCYVAEINGKIVIEYKMSGEKAEVKVRPARHDDYRGVMDINKHVYYGIDYLPDMFHHYIRHPQAHCYVAEINGKIVGFVIGYLLDAGCRVVSVAARTMPSAQGRGVMSALFFDENSYAAQLMKSRPQLSTRAFTSNAAVYYEKLAKRLPGTTIVDKWHFLAYIINGDTYKTRNPALSQFDGIDVQTPPHNEVNNLLRDKHLIADLFGDDKYLVCLYSWFPLPLTEGSLLYMAKYSVIMTTRDTQTGACRALSYSSLSKVSLGVQLRFHFKHAGVNALTVAAHIMAHVVYASKVTPSGCRLGVIIQFPLDVDFDEVGCILQPLLGVHEDTSDWGVLVHQQLTHARL